MTKSYFLAVRMRSRQPSGPISLNIKQNMDFSSMKKQFICELYVCISRLFVLNQCPEMELL
jgi:hypothetical protein